MSTALAMAPSPAPHDKSSFASDLPPSNHAAEDATPATKNGSATQTATTPSSSQKTAAPSSAKATPSAPAQRSGSGSPRGAASGKSSPTNKSSKNAGAPPKIVVKKEPGSPGPPTGRRRPKNLDLSKGAASGSNAPGTGRGPMTGRENLGIQEVGIACLSPGFVTQDPVMKNQLQRSMSVRDQQRLIIEQRLHNKQPAKGDVPETAREPITQFSAKTPGMSRRSKAPPGLSINAPSADQFANERVIQSAPLGQTFTGRHDAQPLSRHITNHPSTLSNTSHIHHVPATQTTNRLPPISDVFGQVSGHPDNAPASLYPGGNRPPLASPGHPPSAMQQHQQVPTPGGSRPREYKSAEEAQAEMAAGRPELLPRYVHYKEGVHTGGPQPPTPPSPAPGSRAATGNSKRRTRAEYEEGASPPLGNGPAPTRRGPFGAGRDSPESQRAKREEFLQLCSRAWDLFHS